LPQVLLLIAARDDEYKTGCNPAAADMSGAALPSLRHSESAALIANCGFPRPDIVAGVRHYDRAQLRLARPPWFAGAGIFSERFLPFGQEQSQSW